MTAINLIHEHIDTAVAFFHGPVNHTTPQQPQAPLVSLYSKCVRLDYKQLNVKRGTDFPKCGMYRAER